MEERVVKHFEIDPFYIYTTLTYSQMVKVNEATNKTTQPLTYSQMVKVNEATNKIYACSLLSASIKSFKPLAIASIFATLPQSSASSSPSNTITSSHKSPP